MINRFFCLRGGRRMEKITPVGILKGVYRKVRLSFQRLYFSLCLWERGFKPNKYGIRKSFSPRDFHERILLLSYHRLELCCCCSNQATPWPSRAIFCWPWGGSVHHVTTCQQVWGLSDIRSEKGFGSLKTMQELLKSFADCCVMWS